MASLKRPGTLATMDQLRTMRVLMPPALALHQFVKRMPEFRARYPQVTVELNSPGPVETLDEAYDLGILSTRLPTTWTGAAGRSILPN